MAEKARIARKEALDMHNLMTLLIADMRITRSFDSRRISEAWDKVTGAGTYTINKFYKDGVLQCTMSSSVLRNQLYFQLEDIRKKINEVLANDPLYSNPEKKIEKIILK